MNYDIFDVVLVIVMAVAGSIFGGTVGVVMAAIAAVGTITVMKRLSSAFTPSRTSVRPALSAKPSGSMVYQVEKGANTLPSFIGGEGRNRA
jgi:hypothetical protein